MFRIIKRSPWIALGAAGAWFLDPVQGPKRRTMVTEKARQWKDDMTSSRPASAPFDAPAGTPASTLPERVRRPDARAAFGVAGLRRPGLLRCDGNDDGKGSCRARAGRRRSPGHRLHRRRARRVGTRSRVGRPHGRRDRRHVGRLRRRSTLARRDVVVGPGGVGQSVQPAVRTARSRAPDLAALDTVGAPRPAPPALPDPPGP